jgi:hypothetical protein
MRRISRVPEASAVTWQLPMALGASVRATMTHAVGAPRLPPGDPATVQDLEPGGYVRRQMRERRG